MKLGQAGWNTLWTLGVKNLGRDFPGGAVVKNPPANAGDTDLSPGAGRFHMPQSDLSPCTTTGPVCHNYWRPRTYSPCSARREATATKSRPCSPKLEKARAQQRRPKAAQNKLKKKKKDSWEMDLSWRVIYIEVIDEVKWEEWAFETGER